MQTEIDIIGGSAAGLFAAYLLARDGKQVRLFDANDVLNVESRTLITTQRLAETLGFFPDEAVVSVEIRGGCRLVDLRAGDKSLTITIRDTHPACTEEFKVRTLIGADGMSSRVTKAVSANGHRTTPLLQAIAELPRGARSGTTQVWFEPDDTPFSIG